jgi:hypothetical protein
MTFAVVYGKDAVDDIDAAFDWLAARVASRSPKVHAQILSDRV